MIWPGRMIFTLIHRCRILSALALAKTGGLAGLASLVACQGGSGNENSADLILRNKAIELSIEFAAKKFSNASLSTKPDGITIISESGSLIMTTKTEYLVDPGKIFTGDLDCDGENDVIVTLTVNRDGFPYSFEHLIFTSDDVNLTFNTASESNMTVFGIRDCLITAEVHSHPPTSPLYDCESCKEVVRFRYDKGDLVRIDP
jgi:hypothetical protein